MARPIRIEYAGALYHVTSRGDRREDIYLTDQDRTDFLQILHQVCERFNWLVHAYCLMDNHYHLLIETPDGNLSRGMRQLNGVYTQTHNRNNNCVGHVFQGRYKGIIVQKESYLLELARYIVLNPVRARMVRHARDWPWSSYKATAGEDAEPVWLTTEWILAAFAQRKSNAQKKYQEFVEQGKGHPVPWEYLKNQVFLGTEAFVTELQAKIKDDKDLSEIPKSQRRPKPLPIDAYERQNGSRNEAIMEAYLSGGYSMKELGDYFGLHYSRVSRIVKLAKTKDKT
jgi:REP element-mobilizing transposase RayT